MWVQVSPVFIHGLHSCVRLYSCAYTHETSRSRASSPLLSRMYVPYVCKISLPPLSPSWPVRVERGDKCRRYRLPPPPPPPSPPFFFPRPLIHGLAFVRSWRTKVPVAIHAASPHKRRLSPIVLCPTDFPVSLVRHYYGYFCPLFPPTTSYARPYQTS